VSAMYTPEVTPIASARTRVDRIPPWSEEAEQAVLAACIADESSLLATLEVLAPDAFYREAHRRIFRAMVSMAESGRKIDGVTLCQQLADVGELESCGGKAYVGVELITPRFDGRNVTDHAAIVREKADRRRMIERLQTAVAEVWDSEIPVRAVASALQSDLLGVAIAPEREGFVRMKHDLWGVMESIEARARGGQAERCVPTGYHEIDTGIAGGIERGEFCVFAGVPGGCKTAAAMNIALNVTLDNIGVLFVSAEMTRRKLILRNLSRASNVPFMRLRTGELEEGDYPRLARGNGILSTVPLWIDETPLPDIRQIKAKCRARKADEPSIGLIVVDFIQLLQRHQEARREREENRSAELTAISYELKGLAKELDVAVIATSQVDASGIEKREQKRPTLADARWSQGMREAADLFALCFRPRMYAGASSLPDTLELNFAKARDSEPFTAVLDWNGATMTLASRSPKPMKPQPEFPL
jgi:replicative DNA helicase